MSYYFSIVNTRDQPLFELEFGTSKQSGDGIARFSQEARNMNPYILHGSLDFIDELQWTNNQMYLKRIDSFASAYISAFLTPTSTRFLLLHLPHPPNQAPQPNPSPLAFPPFQPFTSLPSSGTGNTNTGTSSMTSSRLSTSSTSTATTTNSSSTSASSTSVPNNPTSPQTEEAIRQFFNEVFELWIKAVMNPFQHVEGTPLRSPVFRERVRAAGKKYL